MKQIQLTDLLKWKDTNVPSAFPGKYPTRIGYMMEFQDGTDLRYIGKPNLIAVKKFLQQRSRLDVKAYGEWEFDRGNIITMRGPSRRVSTTHSTLAKLYHPFRTVDGIGVFAQPFYRKRISGWTCYSPYPQLKLPMVKEHKAWLVASGIVKGKAIVQVEQTAALVQCALCGTLNAADRRTCSYCSERMRTAAAATVLGLPWRCDNPHLVCTWINGASRTTCANCGRARTPLAASPTPTIRSVSEWFCNCGTYNLSSSLQCQSCARPRG